MRTTALVYGVFSSTALLAAVPQRIVNTFRLAPKEGTAVIEWVSPSTFRFERTLAKQQGTPKPINVRLVPVSISEQDSGWAFESRAVIVRADADGDRLRINTAAGAPVTELHVNREGGRLAIESPARILEHFFGLGPRTGPLDLRGSTLATGNPFLLSTTGFGEYFREPGEYTFDVASSDPHTVRVAVPGDRINLFFYFGPTVKSVFEEHMAMTGPPDQFDPLDFEVREPKAASAAAEGSWTTLADGIRAWLNGSFSATLLPRFDLAPYGHGDPALFTRAAQVASLAPVLYALAGTDVAEANRRAYRAMESRRRQFVPYLFSYTREIRDRGLPVVRPLALDFEDDPAARLRADEFMLGDELLVAPATTAGGDLKVYLPRGIWTDLETDQVHPGRREITLRAAGDVLPMFARNGTIVAPGAGRRRRGNRAALLPFPWRRVLPRRGERSRRLAGACGARRRPASVWRSSPAQTGSMNGSFVTATVAVRSKVEERSIGRWPIAPSSPRARGITTHIARPCASASGPRQAATKSSTSVCEAGHGLGSSPRLS